MADVKRHDVAAECDNIDKLINEIEESEGRVSFTIGYLGGYENEVELLDALKETIKARGYEYCIEYDEGEIFLTVEQRKEDEE